MIVYLHGSPDKLPTQEHTVFICPAVDVKRDFITDAKGKKTDKRADPPADWMEEVDGQMKPRQIPVVFRFGQAEVDDQIGRYMLARGLAMPTRLVVPNSWTG